MALDLIITATQRFFKSSRSSKMKKSIPLYTLITKELGQNKENQAK